MKPEEERELKRSGMTPAMAMDRPCSANGTKPQPTRGTDLDTMREKKSKTTERRTGERNETYLTPWAAATSVAKKRDKRR